MCSSIRRFAFFFSIFFQAILGRLSPFVRLQLVFLSSSAFFSLQFPNNIVLLPPTIISFSPSKLTITTLLNLNCKRVRTHSPSTLLAAMTSSSSSSPPSTTAVGSLANVQSSSSTREYLCLFSLVTAGLLDDELGSDEQEIIQMINLILDAETRMVRFDFDDQLRR